MITLNNLKEGPLANTLKIIPAIAFLFCLGCTDGASNRVSDTSGGGTSSSGSSGTGTSASGTSNSGNSGTGTSSTSP